MDAAVYARVRAFLDHRAAMTALDPEAITTVARHGDFHTLNVSDLEALLDHDATGPTMVEGEMTCSTCGQPVHVYSPDFDSAVLRHGRFDWDGPFGDPAIGGANGKPEYVDG